MSMNKTQLNLNALLDATVVFGLAAQGHLPTIEKMLSAGDGWDAIAKAIGWERATARAHYELHVGDPATRKLRFCLAESVERLRELHRRHRDEWTGEECNRAAEAWFGAKRELAGATINDF